jgi:hypothetical protein
MGAKECKHGLIQLDVMYQQYTGLFICNNACSLAIWSLQFHITVQPLPLATPPSSNPNEAFDDLTERIGF